MNVTIQCGLAGREAPGRSRPVVPRLFAAVVLVASAVVALTMLAPPANGANPLPGEPVGGFNPPATDGFYMAVEPAAGGKLIVAGSFTQLGGQPRTGVARLNANGTLDTGFVPPEITGGAVNDVAVQADGKIVVGGSFTTVDGNQTSGATSLRRLIRLNPDGSRDTGFTPNVLNDTVYKVKVRPADQHVVVAGAFTDTGYLGDRIVVLESDGGTDWSFHADYMNNAVFDFVFAPDGSIFAGGAFTSVDGQAQQRVVRLDDEGWFDPSFANPGIPAAVETLALQPDGRLLVGGGFAQLGGVELDGIARLNADGTTDLSFRPDFMRAAAPVTDIELLADGRMLVANARDITEIAGFRVARLTSTGARDWTFEAGFFPGGNPSTANLPIADLLPRGGTVIAAGAFSNFGSKAAPGLVALRTTAPAPARLSLLGKPKVRRKLRPNMKRNVLVVVNATNAGEMPTGVMWACPKLRGKSKAAFKVKGAHKGCFRFQGTMSKREFAEVNLKVRKGKVKRGKSYRVDILVRSNDARTNRTVTVKTKLKLKAGK